jgi:hypothetical protein
MTRELISADTKRLIEQDFAPEHRLAAAELLETRCGLNLPLLGDYSTWGIERVRFAVLKLSHGSIDDLARHIEVAMVDWRDSLVAAGFGNSILAHRLWFKDHTGK